MGFETFGFDETFENNYEKYEPFFEMFGKSSEQARQESKEVMETLSSLESGRCKIEECEVSVEQSPENGGGAPTITLSWDTNNTMIQLTPMFTEGRGTESGTIGYSGVFATFTEDDTGVRTMNSDTERDLTEYLGFPKGVGVRIQPTKNSWAVGPSMMSALGEEDNSLDLYVGIGTLINSQRTMYAGFHEAGHVNSDYFNTPREEREGKRMTIDDEKQAWHNGHLLAKKRLKEDDNDTNTLGEFDIYGNTDNTKNFIQSGDMEDLTIGDMEKSALMTYYMTGELHEKDLPAQWLKEKDEILERGLQWAKTSEESYQEMLRQIKGQHRQ